MKFKNQQASVLKRFYISLASSFMLLVGHVNCAQAQQTVQSDNGSVFMEEVPEKKAKAKEAPPLPVDISDTGVPINSKGHMVPLLGGSSAEMNSGTTLDVSRSPSVMYAPNYYLNGAGQKVDVFGNRLPPGNYLPYAPYLTSPGYGATFNSKSPNSQDLNYGSSGTIFGGRSGVGGVFNGGGASGGLLIPGTTEFQNRGSVKPLFPTDQ